MSVSQMSKTQVNRFISFMEDQDVRITRIKSGLLVRFPNGETTTVHFTLSDRRAQDNMIATFRRAGVVHPDDSRITDTLPAYITAHSISPMTRAKALEVLSLLDDPSIVRAKDLTASGFDSPSANRALYHIGYRPVPVSKGKQPRNRKWFAPDGLVEKMRPSDSNDEQDPAETPTEILVAEEGGREFIDSVDSWTASIEEIPSDITVRQYLQSLLSAGLQGEIRIWRRSDRP